jgi:hypothetical protein
MMASTITKIKELDFVYYNVRNNKHNPLHLIYLHNNKPTHFDDKH